MKISFQRTFAQFSENYLATHYGGGISSLSRLAGGPMLIVSGVLISVLANANLQSTFFRTLFVIIAILLIAFGFVRTLLPLFNLFLVWLRRDSLFSKEKGFVEMELTKEFLNVSEGPEKIKLKFDQIKSIQHLTESTWILTEGDYLISIPRDGLTSGNHEKFVAALEEILLVEEEE
jgi:hypothetical protein